MNIKTCSIIASATIAFAGAAYAQPQMNGGLAVVTSPTTSAYTSSSVTLNAANYVSDSSGDFSSLSFPDPVSASTTNLTGLSSTPTAENVPAYFTFSTYAFNLSSITETALGSFSGSGTVVDSSDTFSPTPATFTIGFSGPADTEGANYSFTFTATAVPEPSTLELLASGLAAVWAWRRRKA